MPNVHRYSADLEWIGAAQGPTSDYRGYAREFVLRLPGKVELRGSADPHFVGDPTLHNPEDLLLAAVASCHLLSWLSLCSRRGVRVLSYRDQPEATMAWNGETFAFSEVVLRPRATIQPGDDAALALALHDEAHRLCFIARSVAFPIRCEPTVG